MVWECPAAQVAKELGISDVALGKLCRRYRKDGILGEQGHSVYFKVERTGD
ncbi:MAG: hypothetical protein RQ729_10175 [Wenzhouxiangellaceae bacterium]|nr:hypothetical protein [Wenzhouxiangellaceae bacterium]